MAESNRISVPKELIPHIKAEAASLLLTDDLGSAVAWILRKYFKDQKQEPASTTKAITKTESLTDYDDLFVA
ncbi:hypothetical protein PI95_032220 [Hassallia byssoidea VB512170]|uniref:Uncharacterized protein n=1 Tax=Hassallia byssoidea VB512170 TaxID=1304833 RepID=A0A846HL84_9CYAN|nr:hypothetical protein [Hassalia byssoidea]NEU77040.1 hypothetical protein [Hassalia byssoidea VB512170]